MLLALKGHQNPFFYIRYDFLDSGPYSGQNGYNVPPRRPRRKTTRELAVISVSFVAFLVYLGLERARLARALRLVPRRIAVAGTRGKSGVTRLIAAGLRASGARVLAKTTGSKPVLILPDGSERPVARPGGASIREQVRLVGLAARLRADTLVAEMMSIGAECLAAESRGILRPGTLALTNVRLDHLDDMGRTKDEIARTLAAAFPEGAAVFLPEEELYPAFERAAARTGSTLHPVARVTADGGDSEALRRPFGEFEPNVRLARAVLASLGVDEGTARRGAAGASPDFGSLRAWRGRFGDPPRRAVCVSAFAANDPESTSAVLVRIAERLPLGGRPLAGLLCLREDRGDRTLQWARAAAAGFFRDFSAVVLAGPPARAALRRFRTASAAGQTAYSRFAGPTPEALMDHVLAVAPGEPLVIGLGNIVGWGERLVDHWSEKGTAYDP
jgi:poly-gamma-glutamate synthase PgsB/CapB